jgi:hypothetical protein
MLLTVRAASPWASDLERTKYSVIAVAFVIRHAAPAILAAV